SDRKKTHSANSKVCLYPGEDSHSCRPGCDTTADLSTPLSMAAHALLDKGTTGPLPGMDDKHHQGAENHVLREWNHWWERESNTLSKFSSPLLFLLPCSLDFRSWTRLNMPQTCTSLAWFSLHTDCGAALQTITHVDVVEECPTRDLEGRLQCLASLDTEVILW
ncbi:hypothetical protein G0U57_020847, partial [Chelydra serpentina]